MLNHLHARQFVFFDIETVGAHAQLADAPEEMQQLWRLKCRNWEVDISPEAHFEEKSALHAEFAKVVCISIGFFVPEPDTQTLQLRVKTIEDADEKALLEDFKNLLQTHFNRLEFFKLCGHNIRRFDIPFLCRRMLINEIGLPDLLNVHAFRPWESPYVDTLQLWKFGDFQSSVSLSLLAHSLGVPLPKPDLEPLKIHETYWQNKDVEQIKGYAQNDVVATARVVLKLKNQTSLADENVIFV